MEPGEDLPRLRAIISKLDILLLSLMNLKKTGKIPPEKFDKLAEQMLKPRKEAALLVEEYKREMKLEIYCPKRETEELAMLIEIATRLEMALTEQEIRAYFKNVFAKSKKDQENQRRASIQQTAPSP